MKSDLLESGMGLKDENEKLYENYTRINVKDRLYTFIKTILECIPVNNTDIMKMIDDKELMNSLTNRIIKYMLRDSSDGLDYTNDITNMDVVNMKTTKSKNVSGSPQLDDVIERYMNIKMK